ncbi:MAG TPA: YCF48-related protein [Verrucomicrobiae bacterium]|nr:YCF48-related protein [Verrucomicrobiae bacterium]
MKLKLALLLVFAAAPGLAQDEGSEAPDPAKGEKPQPAMTAPLAGKRTLVSVAQAGSRLLAVGDRGHILASADGKAWQQVQSPVDVMLNRVRFRDDKTGFALGHDAAILVTRDGGSTWTVAHFDASGRALYDVAALDEQRAFAIGGYGTFLDSTDGGATWTAREFPIGELGQHFNAVTRLGDGSLLVVGEKGLLMRSKDQGANWELIDSPYTGSFFGVLPHGEKGAIAFGLRGNVFVAEDVSRCAGLAVEGYDPYSRQTVTDGAQLAKLGWRLLQTPTKESLFGGARGEAATLLVGVNGTVVKVDPAATAATTPRPPDGDTLGEVVFLNGRWVAVGRRGAIDLGAL